jgi:predicted phosphodiesterase
MTGFFNEYSVIVDVKRSVATSNGIPTYVQNDTNYLYVKITNDGQNYDYSSADKYILTFKRSDGQIVIGDGSYENGLIKYTLGATETEVVGTHEVVIQLFLGDTRITTRPFSIRILEDFESGLPSQEEYSLLQKLFIEVDSVKQNTDIAAQYATESAEYAIAKAEELSQAVDSTKINWLTTVAKYTNIATTYPNPTKGDTVQVNNDTTNNGTYRYNGAQWIKIQNPTGYANTSDVGSLVNLNTTNKNNLVEAVNETNVKLAEIETKVNPIPSYFMADIETVNNTVSQVNSMKKLTFGFITDTHSYDNHIEGLVELSKYGQLDFIVHGGDTVLGSPSTAAVRDACTKTAKVLKKAECDVYAIMGNHDVDSNSVMKTSEWTSRVFRLFSKGVITNPLDPDGGYGYFDIEEKKVRVILTNSALFFSGTWTPQELQWLGNKALDMSSKGDDKSNWSILVFGHHCTRSRFTTITVSAYGTQFEQILNAFVNGTSYQFLDIGINVDFTNQGGIPVIAYIFGHTHFDALEIPDGLDFPMISTASSQPDYYTSPPPGNYSYPRTKGTNTEYAMDIFVVNLDAKFINTYRLGAGVDRAIGYSSLLVSDTFNRADGSVGLAETGQQWVAQSGTYAIKSNKLVKTVSGATFDQIVIDSGNPNVAVDVDFVWKTGNTGGLTLRNSDVSNFIQTIITASGLELRKAVAGVYTSLGNYAFTPVNNTTYHFKAILNGDSIKILLDGVERINVTETFNNTQTKHGLRVPNTVFGAEATFDNFVIERI